MENTFIFLLTGRMIFILISHAGHNVPSGFKDGYSPENME